MEQVFVVDKEHEKMRLDVFVEQQMKDFTRSHIKNQIVKEEILVNNKSVKAGYALHAGDKVLVTIEPPKQLDLTPQNLHLDIVFENKDYAVINKPQNMVVHPAVGNYDGTLVNGLLYQIKDLSGINGVARPGIVHRLDKDTSGLIVIAKNDKAHVDLSKQISSKVCKRFYLALLEGEFTKTQGSVESFIARDQKNRLKMAVNFEERGKQATTLWKVVTQYHGYTLVEFELKTGRTHQIRVHAAHMGHPVVGDKQYNPKTKNKFGLSGQLLHAYKLQFYTPDEAKQFVSYEAPLPDYFEQVLHSLTEK